MGAITKINLKKGTVYKAVIRKKGTPTVSKTFLKKSSAVLFINETETLIEKNLFKQDPTLFCEIINRYINEIGSIKPFGKSKKYSLVRLSKSIGQEKLKDLTAEKFYKWGVERRQTCSPCTLAKDMSTIAVVLQTAEDLWDCKPKMHELKKATSNLRRLQLIDQGNERDRRVSDAEIQLLKKHQSTGLPLATWIDFSIATAMRVGEVGSLLWSDITKDGKAIIIRQRKHPRKKRDQEVPLLKAAQEIISKQPKVCDYIFPENPESITNAFRRTRKKAGLIDLHFHDLRHEAISRLFELGFDSMVVATFSGHRDINMLRRYTHINAEKILKFLNN